jgi:uncharacterized protein with PQ loop repeat
MAREPGLHHIHRKERHNIPLSKFDHIMVFVGTIYPLTMLPQIIKIIIEQDSGSVSLLTYSMKFFFVIPWITYGILHKSRAILYSQIAWFITYIIIVVEILVY